MHTVAVVTGGYSSEIEIAVQSADTVMAHLSADQFEVIRVHVEKDGWFAVIGDEKPPINRHNFTVDHGGRTISFDCAFIAIHGTPGEDGKLQAYFDMVELPYTTANHLAATLSFNKYACNTYLRQLGVNCATSIRLLKGDAVDLDSIVAAVGIPCFVKPNDGGSSFGISRVNEIDGVIPAIASAFEHGNEVIIESFMPGQEVTCGVIERDGAPYALPLTEIISDNEFFDFNAKYLGQSQEITPARLDAATTARVQEVAIDIVRKLNLRHLSRMDFILVEGEPYLIEANTVPGLSGESLIPQMAVAAGIPLSEVFGNMILNAIEG